MAVPLNAIGRAAICLNPPWANKIISLRMLANPFGVIPPKLKSFIQPKGSAAPAAALAVVAAKGGVSGGNTKTQRRYAKTGKKPRQTLNQVLGK